MDLVLGTHGLSGFGGSETYLLTVAEQLERVGHSVWVYGGEVGAMGDVARARGLRVTADPRALPERCDGLLVQDAITAVVLAERFGGTPQVFVAHAEAVDMQLPPQIGDLTGTVVAMNDRVAGRMRALAVQPRVVRLRQPIDLRRFAPRGDIRARPKRAVLLGNYLHGEHRRVLVEACSALGLECRQIGRHGHSTPTPELAIADADIVIGHGRAVLEGMACGRAALVYDQKGGDGWVTPESYAALEADGFGGAATELSPDRVLEELHSYRPTMGAANRKLAVRAHTSQRHVQELVGLFRELAPTAAPEPEALREMGRLLRAQWRAESRAMELGLEVRSLRERTARLEQEASAAHAEAARAHQALEAIRGTRRFRLAGALARPLDRARRIVNRRGGGPPDP